MKVIFFISFMLFFSKNAIKEKHKQFIVTWKADEYSKEKIFIVDSIKYLKRDRVNIYINDKIFNVDKNCIVIHPERPIQITRMLHG